MIRFLPYFLVFLTFCISSCTACYQCSFQYYLTEDDQTENKNLINFNTNSGCKENFKQDMEDIFLSKPFRVEGSFSCKKVRG